MGSAGIIVSRSVACSCSTLRINRLWPSRWTASFKTSLVSASATWMRPTLIPFMITSFTPFWL